MTLSLESSLALFKDGIKKAMGQSDKGKWRSKIHYAIRIKLLAQWINVDGII